MKQRPKINRWSIVALSLGFLFFSRTIAVAQCSVEYFWDKDPGVGNGEILTNIDSTDFSYRTNLLTSKLSYGLHQLGIRALNLHNDTIYSSLVTYRQFFIPPTDMKDCSVEYFWDNDPGIGNGKVLTSSDSTVFSFSVDLLADSLSCGLHQLGIRALSHQNNNIYSSLVTYRQFFIPPTVHNLNAVEYFWDTDPGVGNGTKISIAADANNKVSLAFSLFTDDLQDGIHRLGIRVLTDATWSLVEWRNVLIRKVYDDEIGRVEYYWDNDPGRGLGKPLQITSGDEVTFDGYVNVMYLTGKHTMYLRAQSGTGNWSDDYEVGEVEVLGNYTDKVYDDDYTLIDKLSRYDNADEAAIYNKVSYRRAFSNTEWQALYVPFSVCYDEWAADFEIARLNDVHQFDDNGDGTIDRIQLEAIRMTSGSIQPNTPYLIRARTIGEKILSAQADPALYVAEENSFDCTSMNARFVFTGSYNTISGTEMMNNAYYAMGQGRLSKAASSEASLGAFRWYLEIESRNSARVDAPAEVKVIIDDCGSDFTAIQRVNTSQSADGTIPAITAIYSLGGTPVATPIHGINIVKYSDGTVRKIYVK